MHSLQFVIQENETFDEFNSITLVIVLQVSSASSIHNTNTLKINIQIKFQVSHLNRLFVKINKTTWLPIAQPTELKHLGVIESLKTFSPMAPFTQGLFTKSAIKVMAEVTALGIKKNNNNFFLKSSEYDINFNVGLHSQDPSSGQTCSRVPSALLHPGICVYPTAFSVWHQATNTLKQGTEPIRIKCNHSQ